MTSGKSSGDAAEAKQNRKKHVAEGAEHLTVPGKRERLQPAGRDCGVGPEQAGYEEWPGFGSIQKHQALSQNGNRADSESSVDVDGHRSPGKRLSHPACDETGDEEAREPADRTAHRHLQHREAMSVIVPQLLGS